MRASKLAMARKMLKEHQEKKQNPNDISAVDLPSSGHIYQNSAETDFVNTDYRGDESVPSNIQLHQTIVSMDSNQDSTYNQPNDYDARLKEQLKAIEILTTNKRQLETQVLDLHKIIADVENKYTESINSSNIFKQQMNALTGEFDNLKQNYSLIYNELLSKSKILEEKVGMIALLTDENNNLSEQIDITKTALVAKEAENASLHSLLGNLQNKLEVTELRLQQLSNGSIRANPELTDVVKSDENELLIQKVNHLEQYLKSAVSEKEQVSLHYERFVSQLNEQLNVLSTNYSELMKENQVLANRETGLVDQLSFMEQQIQNLRESCATSGTTASQSENNKDLEELHIKYKELEMKLGEVQANYEEAKEKLLLNKTSDHGQNNYTVPTVCSHISPDVNLGKLIDDFTSDKIAAQRATAQNKQLKNEVQDLKEVNIKMSQDKLDLTEKLDAEKFLNRELTLKLSETEEKLKETLIKLKAKDDEMIRLLSSYNELERKLLEQTSKFMSETNKSMTLNNNESNGEEISDETISLNEDNRNFTIEKQNNSSFVNEEANNAINISIKDAMLRLQERFLENINEVAELSDEKHRLEHIIMQLQSETDTICEYVALYQQQRGILKRREEERKEQLQLYEIERNRMKAQLDDLSNIISEISTDHQLQQYFQKDGRENDVSKILNLVANIKKNQLVDSTRQCSDYDSFYQCCSGKIVIV